MDCENNTLIIGLAGDVLIDRDEPGEVFSEVRELLAAPDILFANLESPYTDAPEIAITANISVIPAAHNLNAFAPAGFHVMSMANNHIVDAGHKAMLETRSRLIDQGVATCGAGSDLADARRPAIVERTGSRVGFLAYASVFPHGYDARASIPGLVPLKAYNHYFELANFHGPGILPTIETIPDRNDHLALEADIKELRKTADLIVMSFHWGDYLRPFHLSDHEIRTARRCIDLGADLVAGHHHHALRGIEWHGGKPIFYGLGHFVFDLRLALSEEMKTYLAGADPDSYLVQPREGWPLLPLHPDTRMTILGWVRSKDNVISDAGFVPCRLQPDGRVVAVDPDSSEGRDVVDYLDRCNRTQKLNGKFVSEGAITIGGHKSVRVVPLS